MRIANLDEDPEQRAAVRRAMESIGHECRGLASEAELLDEMKKPGPDLLILDLGMPSIERMRFLRKLREDHGTRLPVIGVGTARTEADMVDALAAGADDFLAKPLRMSMLQARVRALLRRCYTHADESVLNFGPFRFYLAKRCVHVRGEQVSLKLREYDLALYLFRNIGRVLSREQLLDAVWGPGLDGPSRSLDTHMSRLRTKLDLRPANGVLLSAVYGLGYRLEFVNLDDFVSSGSMPLHDEPDPRAAFDVDPQDKLLAGGMLHSHPAA